MTTLSSFDSKVNRFDLASLLNGARQRMMQQHVEHKWRPRRHLQCEVIALGRHLQCDVIALGRRGGRGWNRLFRGRFR